MRSFLKAGLKKSILLGSLFVSMNAFAAVTPCAEPWDSTVAYNGGAQVSQNSHNYSANWWTQGDSPATNSGQWQVWTDKGTCGGVQPVPPTVQITAPANNTKITENSNLTIVADATDADGTVTKVEFFQNGVKLGETTAAPFQYEWVSVPKGQYSITTIATDNDNNTTTSAAITVIAENTGGNQYPIVSLTAPTSGDYTVGSQIAIEAAATDNDGTVNLVEFFAGATKIGQATTSPWSLVWTAETEGTFQLTAVATDNENASTTSTAVSVNIKPKQGSGSCDAPQYVAGTAYADGDRVLNIDSLYTCKVAGWCSAADKKWAYEPGVGTYWESAWDLIGPCDPNKLPVATISQPANGSIFAAGTDVVVTADATDADGTVAKVEFFQNSVKIGEDVVSPYSVTLTAIAPGTSQISVVATDNEGAKGEADVIEILSTADPLMVSISSPTKGATFAEGDTITIDATAVAFAGQISNVEFFAGATKIGEDMTSPYQIQWAGATQGTVNLTAKALDNLGNTATSSAVNLTINPPPGDKILVGYWHNFNNGSGFIKMKDVATEWDVINVSFAEPTTPTSGIMEFAPDPATTVAEFKAGVALQQSRGKKVLISIGGANGQVKLETIEARDNFVRTMIDIIAEYGFDGFDIDFEGHSLYLNRDDHDVKNPTTPVLVNLIHAIRAIHSHFGKDFILTMAPETFFVQMGYTYYGDTNGDQRAGAYLPVIHNVRDILTYIYVQHYNSGQINGLDDVGYNMGTADFHVALAEMLITGFPCRKNPDNVFPGLREDQVLIGLPSMGMAGGGFTPAAEVHKALDYLIKGKSFGGKYKLRNPNGYPNLKGLMTWSINWDVFDNSSFSKTHRQYLDSLNLK